MPAKGRQATLKSGAIQASRASPCALSATVVRGSGGRTAHCAELDGIAMGTAAKLPTRQSHHGPVLCPPESPDHGAMQGALRARQNCAMGRSSSRARTRAPCFRARIRATKRENKWSAAGGARGRARTCSARTALCDARVIPYAARTTLSGAPATFQARATRARAILRRGIPLIPLNPAESRFRFNFCRRWKAESDRDPGEKFVLARNSHRGLSLWTIDRLSQSFAACSGPTARPGCPFRSAV